MLFSINRGIVGKEVNLELRKKIMSHTANSWESMAASYDELFDYITKDGYATSACMDGSFKHGNNFLARDLFMVDIDGGMDIMDLFNDPYYNKFGSGFYATPSYTDENPRLRILFRTPEPITEKEDASAILCGLIKKYRANQEEAKIDSTCKDCCRMFYGNKTEFCEKTNKMLSPEEVSALITLGKQEVVTYYSTDPEYAVEATKMKSEQKEQIMSELRKITPFADRNEWMRVGFAMKRCGFTLSEFMVSTNETSRAESENIWKIQGPKCGKTTLCNVIAKYNNQFRLIGANFYPEGVRLTPDEARRLLRKETLARRRLLRGE